MTISLINHSKTWRLNWLGEDFKSMLEAQWATVFTQLGIRWEYEPRTFNVGKPRYANWYTPDFWLPDLGIWVEVKGQIDAGLWIKYADSVHLGNGSVEYLDANPPAYIDPRLAGSGYPQPAPAPVLLILGDIADPGERMLRPGLYTDAQGALRWAHYMFHVDLGLYKFAEGGILRLPENYIDEFMWGDGVHKKDKQGNYIRPIIDPNWPDIHGRPASGKKTTTYGMTATNWQSPQIQHAFYRAIQLKDEYGKGKPLTPIVHAR